MWGECAASRRGCFIAGEGEPGTHKIKGWVGPRADLEAFKKRQIPYPVPSNYTDYTVSTPRCVVENVLNLLIASAGFRFSTEESNTNWRIN